MPNDFLEKTLEDIVYENRHRVHLDGLQKFKKCVFRQVVLPSGKKMDIFSFEVVDGVLMYDIYELKKDYINIDSICQAYNYFDEVNSLINGSFKDSVASLVMVGRRYEPLSVLDGMKIPVNVYTYDYQYEGIKFCKHNHSESCYDAHEQFSLSVLAFGISKLVFNNGQPSTVSFHNEFGGHLGSDFKQIIKFERDRYKNSQKLLNAPEIAPKVAVVTTVIFPEPPSWTPEFAKDIPHYDMMDDFEIDTTDYEPEEIEADYCDYEAEPDLEEDNYFNFIEPINLYDYTLSEIKIPNYYYVISPHFKN